MVNKQQVSLDKPVRNYLRSWQIPENEFTAKHPITLRMLLSNTGGITGGGFVGYPVQAPIPTLIEILNGKAPANSEPIMVVSEPGEKYEYSSGGFVIAQQILTDIAQRPFGSILSASIFKPLGMLYSNFEQPLGRRKLNKAALPHDRNGVPIVGGPYVYPELGPAGLWSTPSDIARWIIELQRSLGGKSSIGLSAENVRMMFTPILESYGLGAEIRGANGTLAFTHSGANVGYQAFYFAYAAGDGIVILTNGDNGYELILELVRSVSRIYNWKDYKTVTRSRVNIPEEEELKFAGRFTPEGFFPFSIVNQRGHLELSIGGRPSCELISSSPNTFFIREGLIQINFTSPDRGVLMFDNALMPFSRNQ